LISGIFETFINNVLCLNEHKVENILTKIIFFSILISLIAGCVQNTPSGDLTSMTKTAPPPQELVLATTTSTCDTGLLDVLNKKFEETNNVKILTVCEGTGKAIATGELGAADVVMVHSVQAELKAVANGSFINRTYMMYNYFVIIGHENDPAGIRNAINATDAFRKISDRKTDFISRGDDSGTHKMELSIWKSADLTPSGTWYQSVGKGMGETIITADTKNGYTLSDRGTYLAMKDKIKLKILFEKDETFLFNPYHVMAVNPAKFPKVKYGLAMKYIEYVTSQEEQNIIGNYGMDKYGEGLFMPAADIKEQ